MVHKPREPAVFFHSITQALSIVQILLGLAVPIDHCQLLVLAVIGKASAPFCPCNLQYTSLVVIGKDVFPCVPFFPCQLVLLIIGILCFPFQGLLSNPVSHRVIQITDRVIMILLLHQSPPDVIAVSDLDLLVPAIGRSLFPALCDSVPVAIILITEREQDVLPRLCF